MKKVLSTTLVISVISVFPLFLVSAQNLQHPRQDFPDAAQRHQHKLNREARETYGDLNRAELKKAEKKAELKDELAGAPVGKMDVNEFQLKRDELKGKVIELTFDRVISLKQAGQNYVAFVNYQQPRVAAADGLGMIIPPEGLGFFQDLARPGIVRTDSVYVQVLSPTRVKALGTHYRKDKPDGERYNW